MFRLVAGTGSLPSPVLVQGAPGDDDRVFVVLQGGTVRVLVGGVLNADPFYVVPELATGGERGLLGLAFHPKYAENGRFYLHYSRKGDGATVVEERVRGADADHASTAAEAGRTVLVVPQPEANHNGGALSFGPDGFLYLGLGDGGGGGDQHGAVGNGQDQGTLLGKILRLDVDQTGGGAAYGIPPGNLTGAGVRPEIWDLGLRNPWRFSFDACTGDLWIGDVGQGQWEEIDFEPAGEGRCNYGWRAREGRHCYDPALCSSDAPQAGLVDPVLEYKHENGRCSITGGYVYRGSRIPALRGTYFFGDYCTHEIFATRRVDGAVVPAENVTSSLGAGNFGNLLSFGQDNGGELYAATTNGVFRLEAAE
jgi:glucose/arabinose dehydrogenase